LRFKDFQFGLKLISKNTGQDVFTIDVDAVNAPDKILSEWVVKSYRSAPASNPPGPDSRSSVPSATVLTSAEAAAKEGVEP
jgi:hypothetical protein